MPCQIQEEAILPLPQKFHESRNRLRVVGYELVRYTIEYASQEANRYGHPVPDYEYAIHKIGLFGDDGQVYITDVPYRRYCSERSALIIADAYIKEHSANGITAIKDFFSNPGNLIALIVPPFALVLLGLLELGVYMEYKFQKETKKKLYQLKEIPKFEIMRSTF